MSRISGLSYTADPAFVPDPSFVGGLVHTVAVEWDVNSGGANRGAHGSVKRDFQPVKGLETVTCLLIQRGRDVMDVDGRPVQVLNLRVLFDRPYPLDGTHRLVWTDPDRGKPRYLYLKNPAVNERNHHGRANAYEYFNPAQALI
jgi:hypothetical protein